MKLIELVIEVFKHGSWPEGVKYIAQDLDGTLWGYQGDKPYMDDDGWWAADDFNYKQLTSVHAKDVVDDFDTAIISWEEYKKAERDYVTPKPLQIFEDASGSSYTQEFHDHFYKKYGDNLHAIKQQLKKDMEKGVNAVAIMEMINSDLQVVRLMHNFDKGV